MGLFDKLFSLYSKEDAGTNGTPPIFGRYSDNNKNRQQLEEWTLAEKQYEAKKYSESIVHFFTYLRDNDIDNVVFEPYGANANFQIYQGSKRIDGSIDNSCVKAEVTIARLIKRSTPVMRQLLEKNFELYYSKFFLEGDKIKLKIYNNVVAAAPNKLYYALKELSIQADRLDDILVEDFTALEAEGVGHIIENSEAEKKIKYEFFRRWMDTTIEKVENLNQDTYTGAITYLILNLIFKIDYLLLPEGKLTEKLEAVNSLFWNMPEGTHAAHRNYVMLVELKELQAWTEVEVKKYFYKTKHTFSLTKPTSFDKVIATINSSLKNVAWFQENNHPDIALELLEYAMAYSQFSFSLPKPVTELFDLVMQVNHSQYYSDMGYSIKLYDEETKQFDIHAIKKRIETIHVENKERYAQINIDTKALNFDSKQSFILSLLQEIIKLDLRKKK